MVRYFNVEGMSCAACSASVERVVGKLDGIKSVSVNLLEKRMICDFDEKKVTAERICEAVAKAGFEASEIGEKRENTSQKGRSLPSFRTRLLVTVCFLLPLLYLSMGHMLGAPLPGFLSPEKNPLFFALAQLILTLPVVIVNRKFYISGFGALSRRAPNMDSLVAVGSGAALLYGIFAIIMIAVGKAGYAHSLYFESAAMILALVSVGKALEERAKKKTGDALEKLRNLAPDTVTVKKDGKFLEIPQKDLRVGDIVVVRAGQTVPVDGVVTAGTASLNESAVTGESLPVWKNAGERVICASVNENGYLEIRAEKVGAETTLSRIITLIENAGAKKPPISRLADKISGFFVPAVMGIAVFTFILWLLLKAPFETALSRAICVLVISCPCALGLATPVAVTVNMGRCAQSGILVRSADALETLSGVKTVIFDKTGTLTAGKPTVTYEKAFPNPEKLHSVAFSLERLSAHPLASAVLAHCGDTAEPLDVTSFEEIPGKGVRADADGAHLLAGSLAFMTENGIDVQNTALPADLTPLYFAENGKLVGILGVTDPEKTDARQSVSALGGLGVNTVMLSGDRQTVAEAVGKRLGIDRVIAGVLPDGKQAAVDELMKDKTGTVAMVGDGINDAPALAAADIGIAMGSGSDIAIDCADVVLMNTEVKTVLKAIRYSRQMMVNIKENLFWAFFYNVIGIPIAAGALSRFGIGLTPMLGAAAMSLSSLFVVTNALRLKFKK